MEPIEFTAVVYKVQTLVDCGVRVTLDLPETAIMQMAELAECKRAGVALRFAGVPLINSGEQQNDKGQTISGGGERKSKWQTSQG
jgi:hypothetical protein